LGLLFTSGATDGRLLTLPSLIPEERSDKVSPSKTEPLRKEDFSSKQGRAVLEFTSPHFSC
jgi:hypothetical protein